MLYDGRSLICIVVCRLVARRRQRDRRLYSGRCYAAARKNNTGMVFSARSAKQQLNSNTGTVFSVLSMPICYKKDN
jgi:hypothetical protein